MSLILLYQLASILVLTGLLFFPVSRLIGVLNIRRLQKRQAAPLNQQSIQKQLRRARVLGLLVALIFSYFFHYNVLQIAH